MSRSSFKNQSNKRVLFLSVSVITLLVICIAAILYLENKKSAEAKQLVLNQDWPEIENQLKATIEAFDTIADSRPVKVEDVRLLESSKSKLMETIRKYPRIYLPESSSIGKALNDRIELYLADLLWKQSAAAESEAMSLYRRSDEDPTFLDESLVKMREALALQKEINDRFPENTNTNYPRAIQLKTWLQTVEVEPYFKKFLEVKDQAFQEFDSRNWETSIEHFKEAIKLQNQINNQFPEAPQSDESETLRLQDSIHLAEANILFERSLKEYDQAEIYVEAGKEVTALERYQNALELQNKINLQYQYSEVASTERSNAIASKVQELKAQEHIALIYKLNDELSLLQTVGMMENIEYKLQDIQSAFLVLEQDYPLYPNPPEAIRRKCEYLLANFDNLPQIHNAFTSIQKTLIDTSEGNNRYVTALVDQNLYQLVNGENPSRNQGLERPVDSVSFEEVMLFCEKLSFITSAKIELPDRAMCERQLQLDPSQSDDYFIQWVSDNNELPTGQAMTFSLLKGEDTSLLARDVFYRTRNLSFRLTYTAEE